MNRFRFLLSGILLLFTLVFFFKRVSQKDEIIGPTLDPSKEVTVGNDDNSKNNNDNTN